nr:Preprotein-translocase subunit g [Echinothamnion sp.]
MLKFFWYIFSLSTVFCVLLNTPNSSNIGSSINQNSIFSFRSNKLLMERLISLNVLMFFIFTILFLL